MFDQPTEIVLDVQGVKRHVLFARPRRAVKRSSLAICLGGHRSKAFTDSNEHDIVTRTLLGAGHTVASFDLPNHGEQINAFGKNLDGMAAAAAAGHDVFADIQHTGRAVIDWAIAEGLTRPGEVLLQGTSRGGLAALHIMAADDRVLACAIDAPVTHLPTLREFAALADNPIIQRSNAAALIDRLAGRPIFMSMGESDPRVSAEHAFAFMAHLSARAEIDRNEIYCGAGMSHGKTFEPEPGYQAAAAFLIRAHAYHCRKLSSQEQHA